MPEAFDLYGSDWWRCSRYEVFDTYIRPGRGATVERYNPWEAHRSARSGRAVPHKKEHPYEELIALADLLEKHAVGRDIHTSEIEIFDPPPEVAFEIAQWCTRHGLLGSLLHRVLWVALAACRETAEPESQQPVYTLPRYTRAPYGWIDDTRRHSGKFPRGLYRPQTALVRGRWNFQWEEEPLTRTWVRYFPDVPDDQYESYPYPIPLSDDFWAIYGEPVLEFARAALAFRDAVLYLGNPERMRDYPKQFQQHHDRLNILISGTEPVCIRTPDGSLGQVFVAPSLLGAYATMALEDISGEQRVMRCASCKKPFVSDAYQAMYCSDKCRWREQKRRHLAKRKKTKLTKRGRRSSNQ